MKKKKTFFKDGRTWVETENVLLSGHIGHEIKCPFCKTYAHTANILHMCAGCGAIWKEMHKSYFFSR